MSEAQLPTIAEIFLVILGVFFALVGGYVLGYQDAKKHQEKDRD